MTQRRRLKHELSLEHRLASFAETAREVAALLPPGEEKDEMIRKARQADAAVGLYKSFEPSAQPLKARP